MNQATRACMHAHMRTRSRYHLIIIIIILSIVLIDTQIQKYYISATKMTSSDTIDRIWTSLVACQNPDNLSYILSCSAYAMIATAAVTFVATLNINAPYGRYAQNISKGWGPMVHPTVAWIIMESPNIWIALLTLQSCSSSSTSKSFIHYPR